MPKTVDYIGRFAFFEEAAFAIVRDEGVHRLSRHRVAAVLGTSISTVRRALAGHADLRVLALREADQRRRVGRRGHLAGDPLDVAETMLRRVLPDTERRVAEELVWWRVAVAAPTTARMTTDSDHPDGRLRDRFAIGTWGYLPRDLEDLDAAVLPTDGPEGPGHASADSAATVLADRVRHVDEVVATALGVLEVPDGPEGEDERARTRALVDGLGVAVCLGRIGPEEACAVLRSHLEAVRRGAAAA
jgi:hypothetical protein